MHRGLNWETEVGAAGLNSATGKSLWSHSASLSPSLKQHNTKTLNETIIKGLHVSNRQSLLCFNIHF